MFDGHLGDVNEHKTILTNQQGSLRGILIGCTKLFSRTANPYTLHKHLRLLAILFLSATARKKERNVKFCIFWISCICGKGLLPLLQPPHTEKRSKGKIPFLLLFIFRELQKYLPNPARVFIDIDVKLSY